MQKRFTHILLVGLVAALMMTISGLSVAQDGSKTAVIGLSSEPSNLDPRNYSFTPSTFAIAYQIYEPLLYHDTRTDELIPGLAESYEILDEDSYQFNLRQDVTWHDGEAFNADDVVWSLTRTANRVSEYGLDPANPVEVLDEYTIIVNTNGPQGPFLKQNLALNIRILPEHILESYYADARVAEYEATTDEEGNEVTAEAVRDAALRSIDRGDDWQEPAYIGTGPFVFGEWERGRQIVLTANDDYWGGRPNLDEVIFRWVEEDTSRIIGLESGDFDLVLGVPETDVDRLSGVEGVEVLVSPGLGYQMLTMNQSVPALSDVRVRQAIAYAVDQNEIAALYGDLATRTCGPLSVNSGFYNSNVNCFEYDPDAARALLNEAGWDGSTTLQLKTVSDLLDEALLVEFYLEDVGIDVDVQEVDAASYYSEVRSGESELALYSFGNIVDPDHMYWVFTSTILGGRIFSYENVSVDELLLSGQQIADIESRSELYNEAQQTIVDEDTVAVFLYSSAYLRAYRTDRLTGIELMPRPTDVFYWLRSADIVE